MPQGAMMQQQGGMQGGNMAGYQMVVLPADQAKMMAQSGAVIPMGVVQGPGQGGMQGMMAPQGGKGGCFGGGAQGGGWCGGGFSGGKGFQGQGGKGGKGKDGFGSQGGQGGFGGGGNSESQMDDWLA